MPVNVAWQVSCKFAQYGATWSENWYSLSGDTAGALASNIVANPGGVITSFRHQASVFTGVQVRRTDSTRTAAIRFTNANPTIPNVFGSPTPDLVQTSVPFKISAPNGQGRTMWVRGLPDASTLRNTVTGRSDYSAIQTALQAYYELIRFYSQGAIQHTFPAPNSGVGSWQNVTTIGKDPLNPNWTIVTLVGSSLLPAPGTMVYFRGFLTGTFTYLAGNFVVKSNTGVTQFSIPATWREPTDSVTVANVQARQRLYQYDPMDATVTFGQLSSKKTKDPTNGRRGARSKRVRRRLTLVVS